MSSYITLKYPRVRSVCTLLFQDSVGELKVESPSKPGVFIPALPVEGAIVFNVRDFLMQWSNGASTFYFSSSSDPFAIRACVCRHKTLT